MSNRPFLDSRGYNTLLTPLLRNCAKIVAKSILQHFWNPGPWPPPWGSKAAGSPGHGEADFCSGAIVLLNRVAKSIVLLNRVAKSIVLRNRVAESI